MTPPAVSIPREGCDIEQENPGALLRGVTGKNGGLDGGAVCDSLIGVDRLVGLLAVEEVGDELDDTRDTGRAADEDDLVHLRLVDLGVAGDLLNGPEGRAEEVLEELFEAGTGEGGVEVDVLEERVDFDRRLGGGGKGAYGSFSSGTETTESAGVRGERSTNEIKSEPYRINK